MPCKVTSKGVHPAFTCKGLLRISLGNPSLVFLSFCRLNEAQTGAVICLSTITVLSRYISLKSISLLTKSAGAASRIDPSLVQTASANRPWCKRERFNDSDILITSFVIGAALTFDSFTMLKVAPGDSS